MTHRAVALNSKCKSITRNTRTSDQPVTGVTVGCDLVSARRTRDRGRVGAVAARSTGLTHCAVALNGIRKSITRTTRTSDQPVTGVTGGCDLIGAVSTRDRGCVGTVATRSTGSNFIIVQKIARSSYRSTWCFGCNTSSRAARIGRTGNTIGLIITCCTT